MGRLIDADALKERIRRFLSIKSLDDLLPEEKAIVQHIDRMPPVDAIPIDWINLFNSTPIGGDSIDDMLLEWRYKQEVEAERERDEDGNNGRS